MSNGSRPSKYIIDSFEYESRQNPDAIAVLVEDGRPYSYDYVDKAAHNLAKALALAIRENEYDSSSLTPLVSVMMTRDIGIIIAMLGILKAGAAYVPVDPAFPVDRQSHIFTHSKSQLLITDEESFKEASALGVDFPPSIILESTSGRIVKSTFGLANEVIESDDIRNLLFRARQARDLFSNGGLVYVLYTSGSTGKPKGVMVKQEGLVNIIAWFADELKMTRNSVVMGLTTFCFDISMLELFVPLSRGATFVLAKSSTQKNPFVLLDLIRDTGVTVFQATPTTYEMMLATGWSGDKNVDFLVGGEAFRPALLPLIRNSRSVRNVYGPTETTIWSSSYTFPADFPITGTQSIPIGLPISETDFYLVSEASLSSGSPTLVNASAGEEGELWIGGVGVAEGYLHAADLTQARFLKNPFGSCSGMVYRTGDIAKQLQDGSGAYVFVRRMDDQVKIDGFRIELEEVERGFSGHEAVDQAVAIVRNNKLIMYLKAAKGHTLTPAILSDITKAASRTLTYYMMPKSTVIVDSFPQTANGKLDRKALPDPPVETFGVNPLDVEAEIEKPHAASPSGNTLEDYICDIIKRLRGRRPRPTSSFAAIGVDSLGAVIFVKALSDSLGNIRIDPSKMFASGVTIRSFADSLMIRLETEKPSLLKELKLERRVTAVRGDVEEGKTADRQGQGGDDDEEEFDEGSDSIINKEFENVLSSNIRLLEGMRGVFTFMVLYDHHHDPLEKISSHIYADTSLFVIFTGVTTALQLRELFRFTFDPPKKDRSDSQAVPMLSLQPSGPRRMAYLKPRQGHNWSQFILSRLVGLVPVLWVGLLINIPRWIEQDKGQPENGTAATCTFLYVILMQTWYMPQCHSYGPNSVLYASAILNALIIYSAFRLIIIAIQNRVSKWRSSVFDTNFYLSEEEMFDPIFPPLNSNAIHRKRNWKEFIGDAITAISYNRPGPSLVLPLVTFYGVLFGILYGAVGGGKNGILWIPYILGGCAASSALESVHAALVMARKNPHRNSRNRNIIFNAVAPFAFNLFGAAPSSSMTRFDSSDESVVDEVAVELTEQTRNRPPGRSPRHVSVSNEYHPSFLVMRFFPDCIAIAFVIMLSPAGSTEGQAAANLSVTPFLTLGYFVISALQKGEARNNISRWILESPILNFYGYIAYTMYLFQQAAFYYWTPMFKDAHMVDGRVRLGKPGGEFDTLDWYLKIIGILLLSVPCYLIQKYFQDTFIAHLYGRVLASWNSQRIKDV